MSDRPFSSMRFIPLGLAIILTLMTVFGIGAALLTETANQAVNQAQYLSGHYQQARYWVGAEESLERKYRLEPGHDVYAQHRAAAAQLQSNLQQIAQQGSAADRALLHDVLALHAAYLATTNDMFAAVDAGNATAVIQLDHSRVDPVFSQIEASVDTQATRYQQIAAQRSQTLTQTQGWVFVLTPIVYVSGVCLLVLLWRIFLAYQRTLDAARRQEYLRLEQAALTDNLTGLGNHRAYQEEVQREVVRAQRHGIPLSLALIDIDEFKMLNDKHGHAFGDHILGTLGSLLQNLAGTGRAYRIGGDEFALMLPHVAQQHAHTILESIRQAAQQQLNGATLSIGLTDLNLAETDVDTLREQADAALYEAKRRGRNTLVLYNEVRDSISLVSAKKIQALRDLMDAGEMDIVFQPIWNIHRQEILAVEALSRPADIYGFAGPQEAFDVAERIGHEADLDRICVQAIFHHASILPPGVLLFLNVCPRSLNHPQLQADTLAALVHEAGLTTGQVVLEVTERAVTRVETLVQELAALRKKGFKIALDDTGAGNSGLELLTHLGVDYVKIDRGILVKAMQEKTARGVLAGIIAIAHETGSHIIAEGVENMAMLDLVLTLGTATHDNRILGVQGYLLGRPSHTISTDYPLTHTSAYADAA